MIEEKNAIHAPGHGDGTRFVLVRTSHRGNIGAAARAIKVMGFGDLVLVAPRHGPQVLADDETLALASGATDVLACARCVDTLDAALVGITHVCATAMTPRDFGPPVAAPRDHLPALAASVIAGRERVAFVFGNERHGMANTDVWRAHVCLSIPTAPGYGSLNLAQAVQLLAYEWRQQLGAEPVVARTAEAPLAAADEVEGALAHWREVLVAAGFLDPAVPKKLMPRLQTLLNRARLTREELHILRGIARAVDPARVLHDRDDRPTLVRPQDGV
ncbi:RNA methyltransferase [Pseudaquabacterium rugosum]|uniref:RNA methyltransferase n=1 Tax=Pseudaquabacterium rugosum TaxID=2984194 RepID=A0ABU9B6N9_9BURK